MVTQYHTLGLSLSTPALVKIYRVGLAATLMIIIQKPREAYICINSLSSLALAGVQGVKLLCMCPSVWDIMLNNTLKDELRGAEA